MEKQIGIVYMLAGLSSRFGGKAKGLAKVGPNNETLLEFSLKQALPAGFSTIVFIVSDATKPLFEEAFGNEYNGIPIKYAIQSFDPEKRDKPWGTLDALSCAKDFLDFPFVICSGDDIYGKEAYKILADHLRTEETQATVGYKLKNVMSDDGSVNRGIFETDKEDNVLSIVETFKITKENFKEKGLSQETLCSMLLFGLHPDLLSTLNKILIEFKEHHKGERKTEALLPPILGDLIKKGEVKMKAYQTNDKWLGLTNPEDQEKVRKELAKN